jgi:hypothetical protein
MKQKIQEKPGFSIRIMGHKGLEPLTKGLKETGNMVTLFPTHRKPSSQMMFFLFI